MLRGKMKFKSLGKALAVSVEKLNTHPAGDVTLRSLVEHKILRRADTVNGVKIVGEGTLTKKFNVKVAASAKAKKAVVDAGGTMM